MALAPLRPSDPPNYGPYQLHGRLGAGGMGVVYLAFGPDNTAVALKVLQPVLAQDDEYRARFMREVEAARLVDSPHVARVVDAETDSDPLWMATEYVEGATLAHAVGTNGPVPGDRLRGLAADLTAAIAALHDAGLVHRDLKPANVVLAWSGPKLIDFGIAKHEGATDLTQTGVQVGSLLWMSPEMIAGYGAGRPSDVFAWGLCVAFAGTGRPPFGGGNPNAVAYRISNERPDLAGLPGGLTDLVAATLAKDPNARPSAAELRSALGPRGPVPTAVAVPRSEGGWTGPNPTQVGAPVPPIPPVYPGPPWQPGPPATPPRRSRALVLPLVILAVLLAGAGVSIGLLAASGNKNNAAPRAGLSATTSPSDTLSTAPPTTPSTTPPSTPSTSPPTTVLPAQASLTDAESTVMAHGYTPDSEAATYWDPTAPINAIVATLTGSADGYNNYAFFFAGGRYIGRDTKNPSSTIMFVSRTPTVITLSYTIYAPSDPECCPTQGTQSVRYYWNGTQLIPLDPIPSDDPTMNHR